MHTEFYSDFTLRATRGSCELKRPDPSGVVGGFACFEMEDFDCKEGVAKSDGERERESLVPYWSGRTGLVRFCCVFVPGRPRRPVSGFRFSSLRFLGV